MQLYTLYHFLIHPRYSSTHPEYVPVAIVSAIKDVGWNPDDIKKLVLTHGHLDHTGCGKWIVENFIRSIPLSNAV